MSHSDFCCTLDSLAGNMRYKDGSHTYSTTSMFPSRGKEKQSCAFSFSLGFLQNLNLGPQEQWGWGKEQGGPFKFGQAQVFGKASIATQCILGMRWRMYVVAFGLSFQGSPRTVERTFHLRFITISSPWQRRTRCQRLIPGVLCRTVVILCQDVLGNVGRLATTFSLLLCL